jgi:hypothetical protein
MIQYSSITGKSSYWYCKSCYEERMARERFQLKVCQIFGIKSPGPRIWTERKRLMNVYGYTDDAIVDCLDYIYNVEHRDKLTESLALVNPRSMTNMKQWRAFKKAQASSIVASIANTEINEYVVPVQEHKKTKKEINLDDALLE